MNSTGVISPVGLREEPIACPRCGLTSQVSRGLCLNCLLYQGLGEETFDDETLEGVLDEVDIRNVDWRLGNYQILEEIGRGGMGVIYRARQRHSRRIVALKRILAHHADSQQTLVRFRREAEAAASLDHPNILPVYEVSEGEDGLPFFSMKFATGGSLLENQAALNGDKHRAVALMAKVARGVAYAHSRNILHRDLKPGNVLLDSHGEPLVSDFGLAKWLDASSDLTRTLTIFGTPGYIAPEQAHGPAANLKPTADIYSLGAILFDLLAGRPPFLGEHALSVIQQAAEKPAPKLRSIVREVDRDLETVCARCLEREPNARYHSADDLAEDLERWLEGRPVIARPVSFIVRVWRWARRSPKLAASVAGCVLGAAAIAAFTILTIGPNARFQPIPAVSEKSVAVLPFQNLSDEKQDALFANGVQDEILNDLAKVADLKVISRTSVMQYKGGASRNAREISRELRVAHIVEGSVQRVGDRVRVNAQLIDTRTDTQLWSDHYDRQLSDVFALESELAEQIVSKLKVTLAPAVKAAIEERPTSDLVAYELYLRARNLLDAIAFKGGTPNLNEAVTLLENAVSRDSAFLLAYCNLARAHDLLYSLGIDHTPARLALAEKALENATQLRPNAGETHLALARHFYLISRDYDRARDELLAAGKVLPNEPLVFILTGYIDRRQGRWEESTKALERALQLDPKNTSIVQQSAYNYEYLRRFGPIAKSLDRLIATSPKDVTNRVQRGLIELMWKADPRLLHTTVDSVVHEDPNTELAISVPWMYLALCERDKAAVSQILNVKDATDACRDDAIPFPLAWCEGVALRSSGDSNNAREAFTRARNEVQEILKKQPDYAEELSVLGMIDAALGKKEQAIREGKRAVELLPTNKDAMNSPKLSKYLAVIYAWTGEKKLALDELTKLAQTPSDINYGELRLNPYWDPLRTDPRFEKIIQSLSPDTKR